MGPPKDTDLVCPLVLSWTALVSLTVRRDTGQVAVRMGD